MDRLKMPEGEAIEAGIVTRSIESAQRKVEARNFDMRKQLLEYDDVSNDQRKVIYQQRNEILEAQSLLEQATNLRQSAVNDLVRQFVPAESMEEQWDLAALEKALKEEWQLELALVDKVQSADSITDEEILETVQTAASAHFQAKLDVVGETQFSPFIRMVLLQSLDTHWRDHLAALDYLRQGIHLRGYAQKNPKQEYKREAFQLFESMLQTIRGEVTRVLTNVRVQSAEEAQQVEERVELEAERSYAQASYIHAEFSAPPEADPESVALAVQEAPAPEEPAKDQPFRRFAEKIGRNDPCPCGSGRKFKQCHGRIG
jgi:preprotein translocase subunit SecA